MDLPVHLQHRKKKFYAHAQRRLLRDKPIHYIIESTLTFAAGKWQNSQLRVLTCPFVSKADRTHCLLSKIITLVSGKQLPIEQVTAGTKILAHGGDISTVTEEDVQNHAPDGHYTFGINEDEPFFAPSHPFWTTDGWKCLFPASATEENPHINFKQLQIGDIVFRIVPNTDTLVYKPIRICKISMKQVDCPFTFYGLHLDGARSYHANGYVVAANYPVLTEKRIKSEAE